MDVPSTSVTAEREDLADDVFTPDAAPPKSSTTHGDAEVGRQDGGESSGNVLVGGTSYLPSHPEPLLPREDPKVPPAPISISDENYQRGNWGSKFEFLAVILCQLTPISMFTTFSFRVFIGGGLSHMVPYLFFHFFLGFPVILLAISLGQFSSTGFLTSWKFMPVFKGVSVFVFVQSAASMLLTNIFLQKAFSFIFETLVNYPVLPWMTCANPWNTDTCRDRSYVEVTLAGSLAVSADDSDYPGWLSGFSSADAQEETYYVYSPGNEPVTNPAYEYLTYMYGGGRISMVAIIGALAAMVAVFTTIMMGVKVVGKFCIGALAASFCLTILLLVRGCTFPGAYEGYEFLFFPDMSRLLDEQVWKSAFFCVSFPLFFTFWPCLALASHNRFHNNCFLDTALLVMACIFAPILIAVTIFCFTGFHAHQLGLEIHEVVDNGFNLIFAAVPYMLSYSPQHSVWTMAWFGLLVLNLLTTQVGSCLAMVSSILDLFGWVHGWRRLLPVTLVICLSLFILTVVGVYVGLDICGYILDLGFAPTASVPIIIICLSIVWSYGSLQKLNVLRFSKDIESMVGFFPSAFKVMFTFSWALLIPIVFSIAGIVQLRDLFRYFNSATARVSWVACGVAAVVLLIGIIIGAIHETCKHSEEDTYFTNYFYRASILLPQWGPALEPHRQYAGYLPRDFTPQPYHLSHRSHMGEEGAVLVPPTAPEPEEGAPEEVDRQATLPDSTPLRRGTMSSYETQL